MAQAAHTALYNVSQCVSVRSRAPQQYQSAMLDEVIPESVFEHIDFF